MSQRRRPSPRIRPTAERLEARSLLATFLVTSAADAGPGTLRQAIIDANAGAGVDSVAFAIGTGPQVIHLLSPLPAVAAGQPLAIDGTTQPGTGSAPRITLDGTSAGATASGLQLDADGCLVRGLAIGDFGGDGIYVDGSAAQIVGNVIGADPGGTVAQPNGEGIRLVGPASRGLIGGVSVADRNVISGNKTVGVVLYGATLTTVAGNFIGVDSTGERALPNGDRGVLLYGGSEHNMIGGVGAASRNVISGNATEGVGIDDVNSLYNLVAANYIGTDAAGEAAIPNGTYGVVVANGAALNMIGDPVAGGGNLISGNRSAGVAVIAPAPNGNSVLNNVIGLDAAGRAAIPNNVGVVIFGGALKNSIGNGSPLGRNVISGNAGDGVDIFDSTTTGNFVQNNYIGTDPAGSIPVPNGGRGVAVSGGATNTTVGGDFGTLGNVISGNGQEGVALTAVGVGSSVLGNLIGLDATGTAGLPNHVAGVGVYEISLTVGVQTHIGRHAATRNVISGNLGDGILLQGGQGTSIQANLIGLDAAGGRAVGNQGHGIAVTVGSDDVVIGERDSSVSDSASIAADGNIVSGNAETGIVVSQSRQVNILGNIVGTDATKTLILGNTGRPGDPAFGISLVDAPYGNIAGVGQVRNTISANGNGGGGGGGISVSGTSPGLRLYFNTIGPAIASRALRSLGNGGPGVLIRPGPTAVAGDNQGSIRVNEVFNNVGAGVEFVGRGYLDISDNQILDNGGLGIDLGGDGVTPNHPGGPADGPNGLQNYPVLASARSGNGRTIVAGTFDSAPNTDYYLNFYESTDRDPSGHGQGEVYIGYRTVHTDASGHAVLALSVSPALPLGRFLTATAAPQSNQASSEFSNAVAATAAPGSLGASPQGDFDEDGRSDLAVYRPTTAQWLVQRSSNGPFLASFGQPGVDIPIKGQYEGIAETSLAVYRPTTAQWFIQGFLSGSGPGTRVVQFGQPNIDIPVPADYDGDGKTDIAVYRPTTGQWFIQRSTAGPEVISFGGPGDQPVMGDFDGDGKADIALYRKSTGQWLILGSTSGPRAISFGAPNLDVPVPADYDGDGTTDLAVYRPTTSQWLIRRSTAGPVVVAFGGVGLDRPVPADYDGDGKADVAVYRKSTGQWLILQSTAGPRVVAFGQANVDVPIVSPLAYTYPGNVHTFSVQAPIIATASRPSTARKAPGPVVSPRVHRSAARRPAGHHKILFTS